MQKSNRSWAVRRMCSRSCQALCGVPSGLVSYSDSGKSFSAVNTSICALPPRKNSNKCSRSDRSSTLVILASVLLRCAMGVLLPCLGILPTGISGVVEMHQKAFAAIQKTQPQHVVIKKAKVGSHHDVPHKTERPARDAPLRRKHLRAQGAVAVHVLNVAGERGIGVVEEIVPQRAGGAGAGQR